MKNIALLFLIASSTACLDPSADGNLVPLTVDDDTTLPRIALNGSLFHAETFGDPADPVIVMLHGGPGGDYRCLLRLRQPVDGVRLEDHHFVVFWDQRGAGLSRRHDPADLTIAAYDADLLALVDHYSPGRPVVLIGHSWGGMYATSFIAKHPERVAGAVLMDSGPLNSAFFELVKDRINEFALGSEWLNDYTWGSTIMSPDDHARADYLRMLGNLGDSQPGYHLSRTDPSPEWRMGAVVNAVIMNEGVSNGWDFTDGLERFQHPVLFEGSELNEVIGAEFQRRQVTAYERADLVIIEGAGHEHEWTHAEATLRPVFTYLATIGF